MIPTKQDRLAYWDSLINGESSRYFSRYIIANLFADWLVANTIKHCAEIVTLTEDEIKILALLDEL